jgi:hypothetical protein
VYFLTSPLLRWPVQPLEWRALASACDTRQSRRPDLVKKPFEQKRPIETERGPLQPAEVDESSAAGSCEDTHERSGMVEAVCEEEPAPLRGRGTHVQRTTKMVYL